MEVNKPCSGQGFGQSNFYLRINDGYTLIELLIALTVISILAANTLPSLIPLLAQERSTILTNRIVSSLAFARSTAIMKNETVFTCQSDNGRECNHSGDWHNGWIMFIDKNQNNQRDAEEKLLNVFAAANNGTQALFRGAFNIRHYLKFKPSGRVFPNGSFLICNPDIGVGKALIMAHSGRLRLSKIQTNGSPVTCH